MEPKGFHPRAILENGSSSEVGSVSELLGENTSPFESGARIVPRVELR